MNIQQELGGGRRLPVSKVRPALIGLPEYVGTPIETRHRAKRREEFLALLDTLPLDACELADQLVHPEKSLALPASRGKPGRKPSTADIAQFANEQRPKMTWKEIYVDWKRQHPNDPRNSDDDQRDIREAWRRHYGKKMRAN